MSSARNGSFPSLERFFAVWGRRPLVVPRLISPRRMRGWLNLDELSRRISDTDFLMANTVVMRNKDISLNLQASHRQEISERLAESFSIQIRNLERVLPDGAPLVRFGRHLEKTFGHPLDSVTLFITPALEQALPNHSDATEVFVLQISGRKHWTIGSESQTLSPGDFAYVPAGTTHEVKAEGDRPSVSASFIIKPIRYIDLLAQWVSERRSDKRLTRTLPPIGNGFDERLLERDMSSAVESSVRELSDMKRMCDLAKRLAHAKGQAPPVDFGLIEPDKASTEYLLDRSVSFSRYDEGDTIRIMLSGGVDLSVPFYLEPELERILEQKRPFTASDVAVNVTAEDCRKLLRKLNVVGLLRRASNLDEG